MTTDPASLQNLRGIVEPPPVPWWPPAPGWWVVIGVVACALLLFGWRAWRRWRRNAYRRAARAELARASTVPQVAEILKRTALAAYPRTDVASLSGSAWLDWLEETGGRSVPESIGRSLTSAVFGSDDDGASGDLTTFVAQWINRHRAA